MGYVIWCGGAVSKLAGRFGRFSRDFEHNPSLSHVLKDVRNVFDLNFLYLEFS